MTDLCVMVDITAEKAQTAMSVLNGLYNWEHGKGRLYEIFEAYDKRDNSHVGTLRFYPNSYDDIQNIFS